MKRYQSLFKESKIPQIKLPYSHIYVVETFGGHFREEHYGAGDDWTDDSASGDLKDLQYIIEKDFESSFKDVGLAEYINSYYKNIYDKIVAIPAPIVQQGKRDKGFGLKWYVYTNQIIDRKAQKELVGYIEGQESDGWGEGFEQRSIGSDTEEVDVDCEECDGGYVEEYDEEMEEYDRVTCDYCQGNGYTYETETIETYASPWSRDSKDPTIKQLQ